MNKNLFNSYTKAMALGLACWVAVTAVQAQNEPDLPYDSGSTAADGDLIIPQSMPTRWRLASAYDETRNQIVVFGGSGYTLTDSRLDRNFETWVYDNNQWLLKDHPTFVSGRENSAMAYDRARGHIIMFGGVRSDNTILGDTWKWDGTDWEQLNPPASPSPRQFHEMVWDSVNNRIILWGGRDGANQVVEDTWFWNGTTWTEIATATTVNNGNWSSHDNDGMAFEASTGRVILYGQSNRQTWAFDGTDWAIIDTSSDPAFSYAPSMAYDPVRQEIVMKVWGATWIFKNNDWQPAGDATPQTIAYGNLIWHPTLARLVALGGWTGGQIFQNMYSWNGADWDYVIGRAYVVDMNQRPNGIYNYGRIFVPQATDVVFIRNAQNAPVSWLSDGYVEIHGNVILNGQNAPANNGTGEFAKGGPGGYDGGVGGIRFDVSGSFAGSPGQGPGGGDAPTAERQRGGNGVNTANTSLQYGEGGSGGGGGASTGNANGGNGGAGGGFILIAASRDITIQGNILARGGTAGSHASTGGGGAGGSVRLVADRILGSGSVDVRGNSGGGNGKVRMEAFFRPFATESTVPPSVSVPISTFLYEPGSEPTLRVTIIAGANAPANPTGSLNSPDVIFAETGPVTIVVNGTNVPAGTPVSLRITTTEGTLNLPSDGQPPVVMGADGRATFTATVPAGLGTVQAFAELTVQN